MRNLTEMTEDEWLEADGLGGFASGTVSGIRTRRYHALLLTATKPPAGRLVLVNGFDAYMETCNGTYALSSQLYPSDVMHPDGMKRIVEFKREPWPKWIFALEDGMKIQQEIVLLNGASVVALSWRVVNTTAKALLIVRPFLSGRDYHALHHENSAFQFLPEMSDERLVWRPYLGIPGIIALHNGSYQHQPDWYRNFVYQQERERGLDFTEDLATPGVFRFDLSAGEGILVFAAEGFTGNHATFEQSAERLIAEIRAAEQKRRGSFSTPLDRSADASLWYIVAVHDFLAATQSKCSMISLWQKKSLQQAVEAILNGYSQATRYGIHMDQDALLAAGVAGVQLTWRDVKVGDWVIPPRMAKPVEVQALWLNALWIGSQFNERWKEPLARALENFRSRFWNSQIGYLYDVVDADHQPGKLDPSFRPNQIFAVGGLPMQIIDGERARQVVDAVERQLWTPLGLRSLAPTESGYVSRYEGDVRKRDGGYHQGTVWPWLIGPFVEAWVRVHGGDEAAKHEARFRFVTPLLEHLNHAGLGHVSEIADADQPHAPRGCPFQAWSLAELLRLDRVVLASAASRAQRTIAPTYDI